MTIKDVEQLTGITRQNIRFYEREGLIAPCRNPENQYREYSADDVKTLHQIRLYRKLNVSIEDIRSMEGRTLSLESCMEQCISNTEREMVRMAKIKEVCEELRKQDSEGKAPDIEKALKQIDAYEKSGYQFTDITKDYWSMEVVHEVRNLNRQMIKALFFSFVTVIFCNMLYFSLLKPQWMTMVPAAVIGYTAAWVHWGRKNKAILMKHIHFTHVSSGIYLASAVIGVLFYIIENGSIAVTMAVLPNPALMARSVTGAGYIWHFLILLFRNLFYSIIACILFYDTFKQKSVVSALVLSALLYALACLNPYTAPGYLLIGICLGLLYEFTDSLAVCMVPVFFEAVSAGILTMLEFRFPNVLPEFLGTRAYLPVMELLPWLLLAILLILILLYAVSRASGKKVDWSQEWDKAWFISAPPAEGATILNQKAFHEIEKERKRSYRLVDGYLAAAVLLSIWYMTSIL